jgi:hypothetical protein
MAKTMGLQVLGPSEKAINGYRTMIICPDGSKEGWSDSDLYNERRDRFKDWLNGNCYEDDSSPFEWAEIAYSSDSATAEIVVHAWSKSDSDG